MSEILKLHQQTLQTGLKFKKYYICLNDIHRCTIFVTLKVRISIDKNATSKIVDSLSKIVHK
jgi:hypothetical protein